MEPDIPDASLSALMDGSGPAQARDFNASTSPNRIMNFNDAMAALRRHSLKNVPDFNAAVQAARILHRNTAATINSADISNLQAAKDQLHPVDDYLAYIATLHASLAAIELDSPLIPRLIEEVRKLIAATSSVWAQTVPIRWVGVCRHAARIAIETHNTSLALSLIEPLRDASAKLSPGPNFLNPVQVDFLAVCLEAQCYKLAATWIRSFSRLRVDVYATALMGSDVHLFYHYSAMVLIGVKDFRAALQCCRLALSVPAPQPGAFFDVATSTFKLYILLNLLVAGKIPQSLKFSSYQASRMRKISSEYMELSYAFEKRDIKQLEQLVESNKGLFERQGNLGLVKQVATELSKQLIVRLTNSFVTMRLSDVAWRAGLADESAAHAMLIDMIRSNKINASIDDRKGVVRLMDNDEEDENAVARNLSSGHMNDCVNIVQKVEAFREDIEYDPSYIIKELTQQSHNMRRGGPALSTPYTAM